MVNRRNEMSRAPHPHMRRWVDAGVPGFSKLQAASSHSFVAEREVQPPWGNVPPPLFLPPARLIAFLLQVLVKLIEQCTNTVQQLCRNVDIGVAHDKDGGESCSNALSGLPMLLSQMHS